MFYVSMYVSSPRGMLRNTETTQQACQGALGNLSKGTIAASNCQGETRMHGLLATGTMVKWLKDQGATVQGTSNGSGVV